MDDIRIDTNTSIVDFKNCVLDQYRNARIEDEDQGVDLDEETKREIEATSLYSHNKEITEAKVQEIQSELSSKYPNLDKGNNIKSLNSFVAVRTQTINLNVKDTTGSVLLVRCDDEKLAIKFCQDYMAARGLEADTITTSGILSSNTTSEIENFDLSDDFIINIDTNDVALDVSHDSYNIRSEAETEHVKYRALCNAINRIIDTNFGYEYVVAMSNRIYDSASIMRTKLEELNIYEVNLDPLNKQDLQEYIRTKLLESSLLFNITDEFAENLPIREEEGIQGADSLIKMIENNFMSVPRDDSELDSTCLPVIESKEIRVEKILERYKNFVGWDKNIKFIRNKAYRMIRCPSNGPHHIILCGPSGVGKTAFAGTIADVYYELGITSSRKMIKISANDLISCWKGGTVDRFKTILVNARGGVLFIDEAQELFKPGNTNMDDISSGLLTAACSGEVTIVLAGYDELPSYIYKANQGYKSRFPTVLRMEPFTDDELFMILKNKLNESGFSFYTNVRRDIKKLIIYHKTRIGFGNARTMINIADQLIDHMVMQPRFIKVITSEDIRAITPKSTHLSPSAAKVVSIHELGHAVVAWKLGFEIDHISIEPDAVSCGRVVMKKESIRSKSRCIFSIAVSLAGMISEKLYFGETYDGSKSDYLQAVNLAKEMVSELGFAGIIPPSEDTYKDFLIEAEKLATDILQDFSRWIPYLDTKLRKSKVLSKATLEKYLSQCRVSKKPVGGKA